MSGLRPYVVVLRSPSAIRVHPDETLEANIGTVENQVLLVVRTRYQTHESGGLVPREIWFHLMGEYESLELAMEELSMRASSVSAALAVAMNAGTDGLQVELGIEVTEQDSPRAFFENALLDETGLPRSSRLLKIEPSLAFMRAISEHPRVDRLMRAASQYELALRNWLPGQQVLALAHLYMAIEALTVVAREREVERAGSRQALLDEWGIADLKDFDPAVRKRILFQGDSDAYTEAKSASDAFEHGFGSMLDVRRQATDHRIATAGYVREAILKLSGLDDASRVLLMAADLKFPKPSTRLAKYIRATLHGPGAELFTGPNGYPMFQLESSLDSLVNNPDGSFTYSPRESLTPKISPKMRFEDIRFEVWGP